MPQSNEAAVRGATRADTEAICDIYNAALSERESTFWAGLASYSNRPWWRDVLVVERLLDAE